MVESGFYAVVSGGVACGGDEGGLMGRQREKGSKGPSSSSPKLAREREVLGSPKQTVVSAFS